MPDLTSGAAALIVALVLGYLLGSIPFGVLITRALGLGDLRAHRLGQHRRDQRAPHRQQDGGAGDAAARRRPRARSAVLIARALAGEDAAMVAGLGAFLGHLFPVWLGFRGGKGVATFLGTLLALAWPVGLAACATWAATAAISRISSLSALVAAGLAAIWAALLGHGEMTALIVILATLVFARHLPNIARLRAGTEPRIGKR